MVVTRRKVIRGEVVVERVRRVLGLAVFDCWCDFEGELMEIELKVEVRFVVCDGGGCLLACGGMDGCVEELDSGGGGDGRGCDCLSRLRAF